MAKNLKEKLKIHDPQLYMTLSHISKHGNSIEVNKKTAKMDQLSYPLTFTNTPLI